MEREKERYGVEKEEREKRKKRGEDESERIGYIIRGNFEGMLYVIVFFN